MYRSGVNPVYAMMDLMDRLVQWVGFVASRWRRRGAAYEASRRSDITYFIIHRKVNNSDGPS